MEPRPLLYLASPYSHPDPKVEEQRFKIACRVAGKLMQRNFVVYSPIAHCHPIAQLTDLPTGWEYWKRFDETMIHLSEAVAVIISDGWLESKGVQAELAIASKLHKPRFFITEDCYEPERSETYRAALHRWGLLEHLHCSDSADDFWQRRPSL